MCASYLFTALSTGFSVAVTSVCYYFVVVCFYFNLPTFIKYSLIISSSSFLLFSIFRLIASCYTGLNKPKPVFGKYSSNLNSLSFSLFL